MAGLVEVERRPTAGALRDRQGATVGTDRAKARARLVVYSAVLVYAGLFCAAAAVVYLAYMGTRLDLGNMVQAVWSTAHGRFLVGTTAGGHELSWLGAHVDPFLALFVPLWWVWPSPLMLLVVQAIAVSTGALPVYWLARKHTGSERAAAHLAFAYLLYPATQFNTFTAGVGTHAVSFAVPLILFAIWFLDNDRLLPFAALALLAASTKEEIPLAVGFLGIWYGARSGRRAVGATIFALGLAGTLVDVLVIIPHFSATGVSPFAGRYAQVGGTPGGMLHTLASHPLAFVETVATLHKLAFVALLFVPFLGLWLREPLLLLGAVPDLSVDLLSSKPEQTTIFYQYTAGILPFLFAAVALGAARSRRDPGRVSFYVLLASASLAILSPLVAAAGDVPLARSSNPARAAKAHALALVPAGAPVSASERLAGYLSARRYIYLFPHVGDASWIVVDRNDDTYRNTRAYRRAVARTSADPAWRSVYASQGVQVLRRSTR